MAHLSGHQGLGDDPAKDKKKGKQNDTSVFSIKQSNSKETAFLHGKKLATQCPDQAKLPTVLLQRERAGPNEHYTIIRPKKGKQ